MKKVVLLVLTVCILCISCARSDFKVNKVFNQTYVTEDGVMGLSFYVTASVPENTLKLEISSPYSLFLWSTITQKYEKDGLIYYGNSNIVMPSKALLPKGEYTYVLVSKDGRTCEGTFEVKYGDVAEAKERTSSTSLPFYDEISNITFIK